MIYVSVEGFAPSVAWIEAARNALAEASAVTDAEARRKLIGKRSPIWSDIKDALGRFSSYKCWYCEVRQERSDMVIDHFRPKGCVAENRAHHGYWWLAFVPENYRYCCVYCNSYRKGDNEQVRGKQNHFPLLDEADRAYGQSDDLDRERPALLDPTNAADPAFLFFDDEGKAVPHPRLCPVDSPQWRRADLTINILHLNHVGLREQRKQLNRRLKRAYTRIMRHWAGFLAGDEPANTEFCEAAEDLRRALSEQAELTSTARSWVKGRRGDSAIADGILTSIY